MEKSVLLPLLAAMILGACNGPKEKPAHELAALPAKAVTVSVQRGDYLVNTIGCADCHSPKIMTEHGPEPDPGRGLSGHPAGAELSPVFDGPFEGHIVMNMDGTAFKGPWGTSFSANLTPHETGIGTWTEEQFIRAIRKGKYKGLEGSRDLLPIMPWNFYKNLNDADLKSIFAYLKTLKPVDNVVRPPMPPAGA